ncbi:MAG: acyl-CoA dehydrogenase [Candidatus Thermofonsia Clade 1 bacterium]|jgi:alkylation response protein AidB-like acyl-CoA dehydrogenase|uniref:Acyl-CoA dehydrogenase n=1 Tax=Candidatus Thermofonsia Clade 1 bacterium TaxID=2364210 RepID=A0A2M8PCD3_9CHLR|nr:MAG: acyl-CoA dehydrogenase [Candidatus Thermofonsia Clade 1 bacterium]PJF42554.1 MAG: acyl-CoA dehydrogenase [Candidatus Thermofonsia Clade 1 bacterium]RMF49891.1 MAG: acyl-CoA dehydrogenase [Chloroflexota bacterium]
MTITRPTREQILQVAVDLAQKFAARAAQHDAAGTFPHENYADLRTSGYPLLSVPAEFGGWGATLYEAVLAQEQLAMGDGSTALAIGMHVQTIGAAAESRSWANGMFPRLCAEIVRRGALVNSCATEPELGSPSHGGAPKTMARLEGDCWIINGHKTFASLAPELDYFIVTAAFTAEDGSLKAGRFLVERQAAIQIVPTWDALGMRGTGSYDLYLQGARAPREALLSSAPISLADPSKPNINAWFTLIISAVYLGVAAAAQQTALRYAHERVPTALGKPIALLESIQHRLGEGELALKTARAMLYHTAMRWDSEPEARTRMSDALIACKLAVTNAAIQVVNHAMRAVGGASMTHALPLERYYRDVQAGLFHPPSDDNGLLMLGKLALAQL